MPTTIHDVIEQEVAAGAEYVYAYDVAGATRSFFQVFLSSFAPLRASMYVQSPTDTGDRAANRTPKGGGYGRRVELKTDAQTPIQVPAGQSLLVVVKNLGDKPADVSGWVNGSF